MTTPLPTSPAPRNTKLSAYYSRLKVVNSTSPNASPASSDFPATHSTTSDNALDNLPTTGGRQSAIDYANHLAQTLTLPDLMKRSSALREDAERLSASLHASSRLYFTQLSAAASAAKTAVTVAQRLGARGQPDNALISSAEPNEDLPPMPVSPTAPVVVTAVATTAAQCAAIATRLSTTRDRVNALHGIQRISHLLNAAELLSDSLPDIMDNVTSQLCTDASAARHAAFLAARRTSIILHSIRILAVHSFRFSSATDSLQRATTVAKKLIRGRIFPAEDDDFDEDTPQALTLAEAAQLLVLLGTSVDDLREDFLRACMKYVGEPRPTTAAEANVASAGALAKARLQVTFATAEVVPRFYDAADWYSTVFVSNKTQDTSTALDDFTIWASDSTDEFITARVRRVSTDGILENTKEASVLADALVALPNTENAVSGSAKQTETADGPEPSTLIRSRLKAVLSSVADGIRDTIRKASDAQASRSITEAIEKVFDGSYAGQDDGRTRAASDVGGVIQSVCEAYTALTPLLGDNNQWKDEQVFNDVVGGYASKQAESGNVRVIGRAAMLCLALSNERSSQTEEQMHSLGEQLCESAERVVCERVGEILEHKVQAVSDGLVTGNGDEGSSDMKKAVELLAEADDVGMECGIPTLCRGSPDDLTAMTDSSLFLDEGRLGRVIIQKWVEAVRKANIPSAHGVHDLQRYAAMLSASVGFDAVPKITNAAVDRCEDTSVVPLDEDQLAPLRK